MTPNCTFDAQIGLVLLSRAYSYVFLKIISTFDRPRKKEVIQTMFLLVPGIQIGALGLMLAAMLNFFVWPSIFPNANPTGTFLGLTCQQWGIMSLIIAF